MLNELHHNSCQKSSCGICQHQKAKNCIHLINVAISQEQECYLGFNVQL